MLPLDGESNGHTSNGGRSGVIFPDPFMPPMVRQAYFFELSLSMLTYGAIAGWVWTRTADPAAHSAGVSHEIEDAHDQSHRPRGPSCQTRRLETNRACLRELFASPDQQKRQFADLMGLPGPSLLAHFPLTGPLFRCYNASE
jgi:hypothetical protein